jgi:hypothetical protein
VLPSSPEVSYDRYSVLREDLMAACTWEDAERTGLVSDKVTWPAPKRLAAVLFPMLVEIR